MKTKSFRDALQSGRIIFFDGAMGTMLAAAGAGATAVSVHLAYRAAGAQVLITNTFDADRQLLKDRGARAAVSRSCVQACEDARAAAGQEGFVAGDMGPVGALLEPYGEVKESEMRSAFLATARTLAQCGVDLFLVETMTDARELALAVEACRAAAKDVPIAATMSFDPSRQQGFRTSMGVSPAEAARAMLAAGADVVGANCGAITPEQMAEVVAEFRRATDRPVLAQPNAGVPELRAGETLFPLSPEAFAAGMMQVLRAGATLVGGCCGTTPAHIAAMVREAKKNFPARFAPGRSAAPGADAGDIPPREPAKKEV